MASQKRPDRRPARNNYWLRRTLRKHKVKNLMANNGFENKAEAGQYWDSVRKRRIKKLNA